MLLPQLVKQEGLVTVMVMMLMMVPDYSEGQTTCTAITTVYNTSVTCLFAEDISQLGFNVQFFFPNTSVDPNIILACNRQMSGGLTCYKGRQTLFDEKQKIVDRFTLSRPPSLDKLKGGHYRCSAVRPLIHRSEFCPLTYRDVPRLVPLEVPSTAHNEPPPRKAGYDVIQVFMLVAIVIILILLIGMISARFYLWAKRNNVAQWRSRRAGEKKRPGGVEDDTESNPLTGSGPETEQPVTQSLALGLWKVRRSEEEQRMCQGGSDTSEHGAWDESKEGNTGAGKSSKDESEGGETSGGQESHGGEGGVDSKAEMNPQKSETRATGKKRWFNPWN